MNKREDIREKIELNFPIITLDKEDYNLKYILKKLKQNPNVCLIKWDKNEPSNELDLELDIEKQLIIHNENFNFFPSDYIHCLLCTHCTFLNDKPVLPQNWKLREEFSHQEFKSILYSNHINKQACLAFQGLSLSSFDLSQTQLDFHLLLKQIEHVYFTVKHVVELCNTRKYNLSFTGYKLAAWLAQLAVYLAQTEFDFIQTRAVTFDSPGSFDYSNSINLNQLDIINYSFEPNLTNIFLPHLGIQYRIFKKKNSLLNEVVSFLDEFDPKNGLPYKFKHVIKWPYLDVTPFHHNLNINSSNTIEIINKTYFGLANNIYILINVHRDPSILDSLFSDQIYQYELEEVNLNEEKILDMRETSLIKILYNLFCYPNRLDSIEEKFIRKLLINLRKEYRIEEGLIVTNRVPIEKIKSRLRRIQLIGEFSVKKLSINLGKFNSYEPDVNLKFIGRERELTQLNEMLNLRKYIYITGESGCGKTSLAKKFAEQAEKDYLIIWINSNLILKTFLDLANEFSILLDFKQNSATYLDKLFHRLKSELNKFTEINNLKVLFIIDDLTHVTQDDYLNDFKYLTYGFNSNIKFLITSLKVNEMLNLKEIGYLEVGSFSDQECLEYIEKQLKSDTIASKKLAEIVKNKLPIRLEKLVSKVNFHKEWNLNHVLISLENETGNLFYLSQQENRKAFEILSYMSYLDCRYISWNLLKKLFKNKQNSNELKQNLNYLISNSEIYYYKSGYSINKLTQKEVLRSYLHKELKENSIMNKICKVLNKMLQVITFNQQTEELFIHIINLLKFDWKQKLENKNFIELKIKLAKMFQYLYKHSVSLTILKEILNFQITQKPSEVTSLAVTYFYLGQLFYEQNDTCLALNYFEQSLKCQIKSTEIDDKLSTELYFKLGLAHDDLNQFDKALIYYGKALAKYQLTNYSSKITSIRNNIGMIYMNLCNFKKALTYFELNLDEEKHKFMNQLNISVCLTNIAGVHYNEGSYARALGYFKQALNIQLDRLVYNHPDVALAYNNIGGCLHELGHYSQALDYFYKALAIEQEASNNLNIATCYNNLSGVYTKLEDYDKAFDYNQQCLDIRKEHLKLSHPEMGICLLNKAGIYLCLKQYDIAFDYLKQAEKIESKLNIHVDYALTCNNISIVYYRKKDFVKALEYNVKAFDILRSLFDLDHIKALLNNNAGLIYKDLNDSEKALGYLEKANKIFEKLNMNKWNNIVVLNNIGCIYATKKEYKEAISKFEYALNIGKSENYDISTISLVYNNITEIFDRIRYKKKNKLN